MVLAAPGPLLTLPLLPPPRRPVTGPTLSKLRSAMETQPRLCRAAAAAAGGVGAREDRTLGRALNQHRRPTTTPATARLCRGLPPTTEHPPSHPPTKRHTWMPLSGRQQTTCSSSSTSSSPSFPQPASSSPYSVCNRRCTHAHKLAFCLAQLCRIFDLLSSRPPQQIWPDYYRNSGICNWWTSFFFSGCRALVPPTHSGTAPLHGRHGRTTFSASLDCRSYSAVQLCSWQASHYRVYRSCIERALF